MTDNQWYQYLAGLRPDEVNFWKPGGGKRFGAIPAGAPFLFKLHSPLNYIAGGGWFLKYDAFPLNLVWEAFGNKNGAADYTTFRNLVLSHRRDVSLNPVIGCIILTEPFFFEREDWIPVPATWSRHVQQGKTYNTLESDGREVWDVVLERLMRLDRRGEASEREWVGQEQRYGAEYLARARLGQGAFRALVTGAYHRRCAITGEKALPALEAGHIKPFSESGPSRVNNGILLRADIHRLFDTGYLTVTPEHHVEVSRKIREEFENGRDYYQYHGKPLIVLPDQVWEKPGREFLKWHNERVFK